MDAQLADYLGALAPALTLEEHWGALRFALTAYLTDSLPPLDYVTSVRAIVRREGSVLVVRDPVNTHILPGGRREPGESLIETLRREALEESGWSLVEIRQIGIMHFHHLTENPDAYPYPYPDFAQIVCTARADEYLAHLRDANGYELDAQFTPLPDVAAMPLPAIQRVFLDAALSPR